MADFKDHFSGHAGEYAAYRPSYPDDLFEWLALQTPTHDLAWDVGTGSGQAALGVARHFQIVIASDAAEAQVRAATPHARVTYKVMPAERTDIANGSVDLVAVGQAIHWFDFERFYDEVRRVLKPDGVIAAWTYGRNRITPAVDAIVQRYYSETVGRYWPPGRKFVESQYRTVPFPFHEIKAPSFRMQQHWRLDDMLGYLGTWSATKRYAQAHGKNPIDLVREALTRAWGEDDVRVVEWAFHIRVGRV
jgi:SAM-dependent methyltransferase